jgi:hypothetical protein
MESENRLVGLVLAMALLVTGQGCGSAAMEDAGLDPDEPIFDTPDGPERDPEPEPGPEPEPNPEPGVLPPVTDLEPELIMLSGSSNAEHHVWGTSESNVFLAGRHGLLAHFDGARWRPFETGSQQQFTWILGFPPRDVYAGTSNGEVYHFDGRSWNDVKELDELAPTELWGSAPDDIFAIAGPEVAHFDGQKWRRLDTDLRPDSEWTGISGIGEKHVVLIGHEAGSLSSPRFGFFDGENWKELEVPVTTARLYDVWTATREDSFTVGSGGTILHFDGGSLEAMESGTSRDLYSVGGTSASDAYAGGRQSEVMHFDGSQWTRTEAPPNPDKSSQQKIWSIVTLEEGQVLAAGHGVHRFDGTSWETLLSYATEVRDIWATRPDDVLFVGTATHRFDGFSLEAEDLGAFENLELEAAWGTGERTFAVDTYFGEIYMNDGTGWGLMAGDPESSGWTDIHGTSEDDVFAVGYDGRIFHFDGSDWTAMDSNTEDSLNSVWAIAPDDVYATGYGSGMLHYDGVEWTTLLSGSSGLGFRHVLGFDSENILAPSYDDNLYFSDGVSWKPEPSGLPVSSPEIVRVHGTAPDNLYMVGYAGLTHYDGERWTHVSSTRFDGDMQVSAVGPREVYVSARRGTYRFTVPSK